ncbi:protein phosphatase 1 regulatory subunit 42 [Cololabis saira]|uniref:protein phosphatase 1 regulatory subunit 42 n=1 Tax=Cololabis saira TaxID=129043 RepID=UPI002AD58565|nr:protein phosphatase 1 regulatory subunit 42 [Cololabis saira]
MACLTVDLIAKSRKHFKKRKGISFPRYLQTLTHLYFYNENINDIGDLSMCRNLCVLYLYDNQITNIRNLDFASNLTHLYLQKNNITHIDNLYNLHKLSKLYLGGNRITVVEGLEQLHNLQELHLENQRLEPGEKLLFDRRTVLALSETLCVLNVNNNNIDDIRDLAVLKELQEFSAADNTLTHIEELEDVFSLWPQLLVMELRGNPVCKTHKYRDRLTTLCTNLGTLDGREINEITRQFLINWKACKDAKKKRQTKDMRPAPLIQCTLKSKYLINSVMSLPRLQLTNDFDTGHGPHPGHIHSHVNMQRREPHISLSESRMQCQVRSQLEKDTAIGVKALKPAQPLALKTSLHPAVRHKRT